MGGHSTGVMKLLKISPHNAEKMKDQSSSPRMKNVTLELSAAPQKRTPLKKLQPKIAERMNCLVAAYAGDMDTGIRCYSDLVSMLKELNRRELEVVTLAYLKDKRQSARLLLVDALGTAGTTASYHMMRSHVFLPAKPDADLLLRALFQLSSAVESPPPVFLKMLEKIVFYKPYKFADADKTDEVAQAATFALGSVAKRLRQRFPKLSERVVSRLQDTLGLHDPYHYSRMGSVLSETEFARHVDGKATLIDALGNAASESSLGHVLSYVNSTDAHPLLRGCAVSALAHFPQKKVADVLLSVALSDEQFSIRHAAITSYTKHPHGGDIRVLLDSKYGSTHNVTLPVYRRMRRSVDKVLGAIWKGFKFLLQSPGVDWQKTIGSNKLGASMGLVVRNILDIEIKPLQGHLVIDIFDTAYVTLHAGIVNKHIDIFRAEICFYGQIEYDLNILKEYGYDKIKKMAELYDTIVNEVVVDIKDAMKMFKENAEALVVDTVKIDFDKIIKTLIAAIRNLPRTVISLRGVGRKILRIVGQFEDMPRVVNQINELVSYVSDLFNDIKTDIMNMYNAIADIITSILPWAWNETKGAFKEIRSAFKKLVTNPKFAIQEMGNAVARVGAAVAVVIQAKDKVIQYNIFAKDNRPYWFDVKTIIKNLATKVKDIGDSIKNTIADLKKQTNDLASEFEKSFTGVDLVQMKTNALNQIKHVLQTELDGPLADLVELLKEFQFIDHFSNIIKSVKKAWDALIKGYNTARTKLEEIFGPKMHENFFRKYMLACGGGFYPTTGDDGQYPPGVALVGHNDSITVRSQNIPSYFPSIICFVLIKKMQVCSRL
ncbi:hypothetical protein NP493_715g02033 [Ridgeia piscesae]|uniref:Uncharacterized protein n=1 Tax=Ridgeia piscesae TaxID=27915 RepID=A0AAD9NP75_RIDPI|nr:hypothetical protein NP493_715g02033 [Ridgeia piscesae]